MLPNFSLFSDEINWVQRGKVFQLVATMREIINPCKKTNIQKEMKRCFSEGGKDNGCENWNYLHFEITTHVNQIKITVYFKIYTFKVLLHS